jgi:hypothetical protein
VAANSLSAFKQLLNSTLGKTMSKELEISEITLAFIEQPAELIKLDDISLALIGGGELSVGL